MKLGDFFKYTAISARMVLDRIMGRKVVVSHLTAAGQGQFLGPILEELAARDLRLSFYMAHDFPLANMDKRLGIPKKKHFPSHLARHLFLTQVFLEAEIYGRGPAGAVKIFFGHGQPNKHTNWDGDNLKAFDWYFLYGELERSMFEAVVVEQPENAGHIRLMDVGYPKLDALVRGDYDVEGLRRELGLNPDLPTVLYAPAWDPGGSLRTQGLEVVKRLVAEDKWNVLVKLHPASLEPKGSKYYELLTGGRDWNAVFGGFDGGPGYRYISDYAIDPYLGLADVMVTDFSGVALEFMTQDKPVVYIHCPDFYEKTLPQWGSNPDMALNDDRFNAGRNAGLVVFNIDNLGEAVVEALGNPAEVAKRRCLLMQRFLYNPGQGAKAAADGVEEALGLRTDGA